MEHSRNRNRTPAGRIGVGKDMKEERIKIKEEYRYGIV
jgi:hypothetical protein